MPVTVTVHSRKGAPGQEKNLTRQVAVPILNFERA